MQKKNKKKSLKDIQNNRQKNVINDKKRSVCVGGDKKKGCKIK